jgi:hypothetical protein
MQCASLEYARNVCGLEQADSTEFDEDTPDPVIFKLRDLLGVENLGGTMRLGAYPCELRDGSLAQQVYDATRSANATAIVTNSTRPTLIGWERTAWSFRANRPTANLSRSSNSPIIPGFWAASFTLN